MSELTKAKEKVFHAYRLQKRYLARAESKLIQTPTEDLLRECAERRGILKGIERCWDVIEERINDHEFDFYGEQSNEQCHPSAR